jgi:SAM-dependent methyltransferase
MVQSVKGLLTHSMIKRRAGMGLADRRSDHEQRVSKEIETYKRIENIHELPAIFNYWCGKFLGSHVEEIFDVRSGYQAMAEAIVSSVRDTDNPNIVSIGAGDGTVEIILAQRMLSCGLQHFQFECVELNPHLIERGQISVGEKGLGRHITFRQADLSAWCPDKVYGAAFAHHSLHHIVALERVFDEVAAHLDPRGSFVAADMIGRNGHMRWPEVLEPLQNLWAMLPRRRKYHHILGRVVDPYENWDCSKEGFEGIRAQDIMPCLVERFSFTRLCVWGGMLDALIDRGYGHNYDPDVKEDAALVDWLWEWDCARLKGRETTPTQIIGVMKMQMQPEPLRSSFGLTPAECVRVP